MALLNRYPALGGLFKGFRKSQVKTLTLVVLTYRHGTPAPPPVPVLLVDQGLDGPCLGGADGKLIYGQPCAHLDRGPVLVEDGEGLSGREIVEVEQRRMERAGNKERLLEDLAVLKGVR